MELSGGLPSLEELHLKLSCDIKRDNSAALSFIAGCPNLTRLYVNGKRPDLEFDPYDSDDSNSGYCDELWRLVQSDTFPWHQLTTLSWALHVVGSELVKILSFTERLETLELEGSAPILYDFPRLQQVPPVTLSYLKRLRFSKSQEDVLGAICCPALEHLRISGAGDLELSAFFATSKPPLKTLHAGDWQMLDSSTMNALLPVLEELIVDCFLNNLFFVIPSAARPEGRIPPTKILSLRIPTPIGEVCDDYYTGITSGLRTYWQHHGLESLNLLMRKGPYYMPCTPTEMSGHRSREDIKSSPLYLSLEELRSEGLKITVSYSTIRAPSACHPLTVHAPSVHCPLF